jgi:hypothetical protein
MPEMWAITEDSEGVTCNVDDPVARALCEHPEYRDLAPKDLAAILDCSIAQAQAGILRLASKASGMRVVLRGVSFDEAIAEGGKKMGRFPIAFARARNDAGAFNLPSIPPLSQNPIALLAIGFVAGYGVSILLRRMDHG